VEGSDFRGPAGDHHRTLTREVRGFSRQAPGGDFPYKSPGSPSQTRSHALSILDSNWDIRLRLGDHPRLRRSIMKRWIHLLPVVAIAATVAHYATAAVVRHDQRPAPEGWKSHDDPRGTGPRLPHRDLLLDSGVVGPNHNPLDRLRRGGLI